MRRAPASGGRRCIRCAGCFAGTRWFGRRAGLLAAAVYATAPMTLIDARQMTTDGLLVLWFTIALLAFYELHSHHALRRQFLTYALFPWRLSRIPLLLTLGFWLACALAVLTKGAVGLLIPAMVISAYLLFDRFIALAGWGDGQGLRFRREVLLLQQEEGAGPQ